jgi:uncharacterized protein with NAD-binding domain and iron-sulfur cluster
MTKRVVILGGGVAGMSAAHELIERGFDVSVFEKKAIPGGKARSVPKLHSGTGGRRDLPGEHGFRFFPRFYKHLPDTMKHIPFGNNPNGVYDNLIDTTRLEYARRGKAPIVLVDRFPTTLDAWTLVFKDTFHTDWGFKEGEREYFAARIWQVITSCEDRRLDEYEKLSWWDYVGAATRSETYERYLAVGLTRSLNAAKAQLASTKTIGDVYIQLMLDVVTPGVSSDRLLNGPTNDVWIDPWLAYLRKKGVRYETNCNWETLQYKNGAVAGATLSRNGKTFDVEGDYYLVCVPLEVISKKLTRDLLAADPTLEGIHTIHKNVQWMNGIQFYLKKDVPLVHGHTIYVDSAWALTSVSQAQFWPGYKLSEFGDGTVEGILSVDISEWEVAGSERFAASRTAKECTREQIAEETWHQLKESLNVQGQTVLSDEMRHSWFLDPDIVPDLHPGARARELNVEPLLVNYVNSWQHRPDAHTRIPNLFLAADYVRTFTDLATMEGANEAARRAVNCILDRSGSSAEMCRLWKLHEPDVLALWRQSDKARYDQGLPWNGKVKLPSGCLGFFRR